MNEEKQVKQQLKKNMLLNLVTFAIIFYLLGMVIYSQFHNSLYLSADTELKKVIGQEERREERERRIPYKNEIQLEEKNQNPRLVIIARDEKGNRIEDNKLQNEIFQDIKFDVNQMQTIYEIDVKGYAYRAINYQTNDGTYKQVLINVDAEKDMAQKFVTNLTISFIVSILIILIASYVLSKKTLEPIVQSWKKQKQFVQDASHELRTPLAIIQAKQESLLRNPQAKIMDNVEAISITLQETQRLTKLIKELMELAKSDSGKLTLNKESFLVDEEIKNMVNPYSEVAKAEGKEFILQLAYQNTLVADVNKIKELLIILLDNSLKYTKPKDTIEVKSYAKDNKCVIEVIDTGIGISKEAMSHVFERFYREEKSRNRSKGGMGLGLSIAYHIVELHKGSIKFDKNREKGTKVIVKLPMKG